MKKNDGEKFPKWQDTQIGKSKKTYTQYANQVDPESENALANPDHQFSEEDGYTAKMQRGPKEMAAFKILDKAVRSLSKKQRDAYKHVYRDGFTLAAAGMLLGGISPQAVQKNLRAALRNISAYCKLHESEIESAS